MTETHKGKNVLIPRIALTLKNNRWPFVLQRRQYPIKVCYAMTINKSQGADIINCWCLFTKTSFYTWQLYVVISCVTSKDGLKILIDDEDGKCTNKTKNVVYREVFSRLHVKNSS
jgi:ATP-dependent DNA helicase PIF1